MAEFSFDGRPVALRPGQTVAGALWAAGIRSWRTTRIGAAPRGLFCGIGACFDCLATIDGEPAQRACLTPARPGTVVTSHPGDAPMRPGAAPAAERGRSGAGRVGSAKERSGSGAQRGRSGAARFGGAGAAVRPGADGRSVASAAGVSSAPSAYDVLVVGAGPAGLAAAATAALGGVRVALLDAARQPGGQFWRYREGQPPAGMRDGSVFTGLLSIVEERVDYVPGATVWFAESGFEPQTKGFEPHAKGFVPPTKGFVLHTTAGRFSAPHVVLATGAYDRVLPFPGWELPGVVTPGGAQALLKGSGVAVGRQVVVAGAGPFLLPVAVGLAEAGVRVVGVFEAGDPRRYARAPGGLPGLAGKVGEAAGYLAALARHRVPYRIRHAVVAAHATRRDSAAVSGVDIARLDEHGRIVPLSTKSLACDAVAVGYGFTANLELALTLGCRTGRGADGGLAVLVEPGGQTSVPGVYAAGEITGVGGAKLAVIEGELAGASAAASAIGAANVARAEYGPTAGRAPALSTRDIASLSRRRRRLRAFADAMAVAHAVPAGWSTWPLKDTLVCRCEEVTFGAVAAAVTEFGATDARTVKMLTRAGMGWCQGRECGYATAAVTARLCGREVTPVDLLQFANRPLAYPVRLGDLAATQQADPPAPQQRDQASPQQGDLAAPQ